MTDDKDIPEFPIAGIGASAGGLSALQEMVGKIPPDSGFCYVIIQHLAPDHPSIMDQLLEPHTSLPIDKIKDGMSAKPNQIFIIPPGPMLTIEDGVFKLHDRTDHGVRTPIDRFFNSLAEYAGRQAYCVVLSGTGTDGTNGLRDIKAKGGFAIVQEQGSARFPGMPNSAKATGLVDFVLKPRDIPAHLIDIQTHRRKLETNKDQSELHREIKTNLDTIYDLLRIEHGDDFSAYKTGTIIRRIERRMLLLRYQTIDAFIELLQKESDERARLRQDFLIGVTHFYRDPSVWDHMRAMVLLPILANGGDSVRIWVPGCSTGEEAYTIAILMREIMQEAGDRRTIQIFGTDIDQAALLQARKGIYPPSAISEVPEDLVEKYFSSTTEGFQIAPMIREMCVFAPHNLLQDPPFSRIDLISCRNVLIYLSTEVQNDLFPRFHYALKPSGYLLLGPSESLGSQDRFFSNLERQSRIYQRNDDEALGFSSLESGVRGIQSRRRLPSGLRDQDFDNRTKAKSQNIETIAEDFFLRQVAPPFAVVDENMTIRYLSETMSTFVKPTGGVPSSELDQFITRELRLPTRAAITEVVETGDIATELNIVVTIAGERKLFDLIARPIIGHQNLFMVSVNEVRVQKSADLSSPDMRSKTDRELLERELTVARQQVRTLNLDYESTEQELRSSNEELLSMNEELQSSNEELETSREELQSINEELETINAELTENNTKLVEANSDLKNLFESTDVATLFLDSLNHLRRFTPQAKTLLSVRERDLGRPITDLSSRIDFDALEADIETVAKDLQPIEREIDIDTTNETFILRVRPYRTTEDRIDGCVITFFDITTRKKYEKQLADNAQQLAQQYAELKTLYDQAPVGLSLIDGNFRYLRINERLAEINGFTPEEHIGKTQAEMVEDINAKIYDIQKKVLETGIPATGIEVRGTTPADPDRERSWITDYFPIKHGDDIFGLGSCVVETTETLAMRRDLEESQRLQSLALEAGRLNAFNIDMAFVDLSRDDIEEHIKDASTASRSMKKTFSHMKREEKDRFVTAIRGSQETGDPFQIICEVTDPGSDTSRYIEISGQYFDDKVVPPQIIGLKRDVTAEVRAGKQQDILLRELQHRVKNTLATILSIVRFSAESVDTVQGLIDTVEERLLAISKTHDVLTDNSWSGTQIRTLFENELGPYETNRDGKTWSYKGDDVTVSAEHALALTLGFHELTTNAAKYGALSASSGLIDIHVKQSSQTGAVTIKWSETGGPAIDTSADRREGFGSFMIDQVLAGELRGEVDRTLKPSGLVCEISFTPEKPDLRSKPQR